MDVGFFEDLPIGAQRQTLAAHFKFCQGHDSNTWSHDLAGNRNREVSPQAFDKGKSRVWMGEKKEDRGLYGEVGVAAVNQPLPGPFPLPDKSTVIDVGFLKPPRLRSFAERKAECVPV